MPTGSTASRHTFRNVIGSYWLAQEETANASWTRDVASVFDTDQPQEEYPWLGQNPTVRKWDAERTAQELRGDKVILVNDDYEGTIEFRRKDWRRDKTGQMQARVGELGDRAAQLPQKLITTLLIANGTAYDGSAFFAAHTVGAGSFDNDLGTGDGLAGGAAPTSAQMSTNILTVIQQMMGFKDDQGEPMHEFARAFTVMVPVNMWQATIAALQDEFTSAGVSNTLQSAMARGLSIMPVVNARLTATNVFYVFRTDARVRSFIYQEELNRLEFLGPDSEHAIKTNRVLFGAHIAGAAGYGRPELAARGTTS